MSEHVNISAYEGVESYSTFNNKTFVEYCDNKISECDKHIAFIKNNINNNDLGVVIEVGSGNGKLLFALERDGFITKGTGFELSNSRVFFANKFGALFNSKIVEIICGNFLDQDIEDNSTDLIIAVDLVIQLISAINDQEESNFLKKVHEALKPGGYFLIELMDFSNLIKMHGINNGDLKIWKEFDLSDPWQFGLDDFMIEGDNINCDKSFIARDRKISNSSFSNILKHYTFDSLAKKLVSVGFSVSKIKKYQYWDSKGDILEDELIILAEKD